MRISEEKGTLHENLRCSILFLSCIIPSQPPNDVCLCRKKGRPSLLSLTFSFGVKLNNGYLRTDTMIDSFGVILQFVSLTEETSIDYPYLLLSVQQLKTLGYDIGSAKLHADLLML